MKKSIALLLVLLLMLAALVGCKTQQQQVGTNTRPGNAGGGKTSGKLIGLCVPEQTSPRWQEDAAVITQQLEQKGYQVLLEDGQGDSTLQMTQVEKLIAMPVDCLVIAAIDSLALMQVMDQAKAANIPVVAYDRLLMNTDALSCYIGFDSEKAGVLIAQRIIDEKQLQTAQAEARSYTIEFFMGSPEDHNAVVLHQGMMQLLQGYLDSGVLVCRSGRVAFEDTCTQSWSQEEVQADCWEYLNTIYSDAAPDILCTASDSLAAGCRGALERAGYTAGEGWPMITGREATLTAAKSILSGHQSMSVFHDTAALREKCVSAVGAVLSGSQGSWAEGVCENGVVQVPATLCEPVAVDAQNLREVLVDSGIYTEQQLTEEQNPG